MNKQNQRFNARKNTMETTRETLAKLRVGLGCLWDMLSSSSLRRQVPDKEANRAMSNTVSP